MNALIKLSDEARAQLLRATGLDELEYQLLILESGCQHLDELVRPVGTISRETCELYREHLCTIGWWTWYEHTFRAFEVRLASEWFGPESLVPFQSDQWRRERLLAEAYSLRHTQQYLRAFDVWLKLLEDKRVLVIPARPTTATQQPHDHVSH